MRGDIWSRLHRLGLSNFGRRLLSSTRQIDLLVVAKSLSCHRSISSLEIRTLIDTKLRNSKGVIDRKLFRDEIRRLVSFIPSHERYYLSSRLTGLLHTLWSHGYSIHCELFINQSCSIFGICNLRTASIKEINEARHRIYRNGNKRKLTYRLFISDRR